MKIAVVGSGIAGNVAAYKLQKEHDITVYEAAGRIGGHSNTVDVQVQGKEYAIDTGFIVYNNRTYPEFIRLLQELDVLSQPSEMSFSVRCESTGLEYSGSNLNTLFAQRSNILRPRFYRMLLDILRFNRDAPAVLDSASIGLTLDEYLQQGDYSAEFQQHYIMPMGAAIWSATPGGMGAVPAVFFIRFLQNHGLLSINDRPQWRVIHGGSRNYVNQLVAGFRHQIRLQTPVQWIKRHANHVEVKATGHPVEHFDRVFLACHSDQALALLQDPGEAESETLSAIRYQRNEAVLHTDSSVMPQSRRAWAAWNYHLPKDDAGNDGRVRLSYNMNILQSLQAPVDFCVTLNHRQAIDPRSVLGSYDYDHPIFDEAAVAAQQRQREINGQFNTYFCGAYWRNGFHEDGVVSALQALNHFEQDRQDVQVRPALVA